MQSLILSLSARIKHWLNFIMYFLGKKKIYEKWIHRTAGEEGGYLFNSPVSLPPASQTLRH